MNKRIARKIINRHDWGLGNYHYSIGRFSKKPRSKEKEMYLFCKALVVLGAKYKIISEVELEIINPNCLKK